MWIDIKYTIVHYSKEVMHYLKEVNAGNAGQKYCRMLPLEHSAILSTFIKLPFVIKIFVLSIFEWPLKTGFTGHYIDKKNKIFLPAV